MRSSWLLCGLALSLPVSAEVVHVAPGDSVQEALDRARPGDTVRLARGVHRERVAMQTSGVYGRPIVLEGEPGAVLDGSEPVELDWRPAPDVAAGAWRSKVPFTPFTVTANGKIITMLREDRVDLARVEDETWHWPKLFRDGVRQSGWEGVKALALYFSAKKELLVRFRDDLDPRSLAITVAPRRPCVEIVGADRCVVRGLSLRNAAYGVRIEDSLGSVVERCTIGPVDYGVWLGVGADRCTVRFNEIFMAPYAGADPYGAGAWDNWLAHKRGGHYDRFGVQIHRTAGGHEVHDNFIHDTWDGIEDRGGVGENRGLRIHHNRIATINDDGLEPNGAEEDCRWHDNIVERCICGFRIKAPTVGPLYAYRNIFFDNKEDYRNYGEAELRPATVFVYHNTSTSRAAIMSNKVFGIGTPNYHYFNNLFWCVYWWGNSGNSVEPNWRGDHNVYVRRDADARWDKGIALARRLGLDGSSLFTGGDPGFADFAKHDVSLRPEGPARGGGGDLVKLLGRELPGLLPGETPDAGALQFGEPMPDLPRAPEMVQTAPAGTWPGPDARRAEPAIMGPSLLTNGGFEEGFTGWEGATEEVHRLATGDAAEGRRYLVVTVGDEMPYLRQRVKGLSPGTRYVLIYRSRRSGIEDFRVIVRNLENQAYLTVGSASPNPRWRRTVLRFTAPGPEVEVQLSPRTPGRCELDDFAVHALRSPTTRR